MCILSKITGKTYPWCVTQEMLTLYTETWFGF